MKAKLTPWQKIVRAYKRGTGLRLSRDEIDRLNMDDAITTRATNDDHGWNHNEYGGEFTKAHTRSAWVARQQEVKE